MKLKGINPLEQHVEKLVVGVLGVGLMGVVGWQLFGQTMITVGKKDVAIADAFLPAADAALKTKSEVDNPSPSFPASPDASPLKDFGKLARADIAKPGKLPAMGPALALGASAGSVVSGDAMYAALVAPAPGKIWSHAFRGTIDPAEKVSIEGLAAFLPKEQPYDKAAVSIEASFDGKALKSLLSADPDGPGPLSAIPTDWWSNRTEIISVQVEREERTETGSWGGAMVLPALPGRIDFLKTWNETVKTGGDAPILIDQATKDAEQIQRPAFYDMLVGTWRKPSSVTNLNFNQAAYDALSEQYKEMSGELQTKEQELAAVPKDDPRRTDPTPTPTPTGAGGGGGGGKGASGAGGGGGGARPGPSQPEKREETNAAKRARLTREVNSLKAKIEETKKKIVDMGGELPLNDGSGIPGATPTPGTPTAANDRTLENADVRVYAHDLTAIPGKVYRYRVRIVLNNPFFGKDIMLKEGDAAQKSLAQASIVMGTWSDWSSDTYVLRDAYWFVTSATQDPLRQNLVRASAELYQFYYGHYRRAEVSLEPGDALVGETKLPKLFIFDETKLADASSTTGVNPDPSGRTGARQPAADPNATNPDGAPVDAAPPNSTPAKAKLTFTDTGEVVLLDVKTPAGTGERMQVVVRTFGGAIVIKSPEADRGSDTYKRVSADAEAGISQGQPKVAPKPKTKPNEEPTNPIDSPGRGGKGAGGGGGGGG